jgi:uncharacterized protein
VTRKCSRPWSLEAVAALCAFALASIAGCQRAQRNPSESAIHSITQEFASAASRAAPSGSAIKTKRTATSSPETSDSVLIRLRLPDPGGGPASSAKVLQALSVVATRHRLTQDPPESSGNSLRIRMRSGGSVTHEIILEQGLVSASAKPAAPDTSAPGARLAIILDDLGGDNGAAYAIFALHFPLTVSILPDHAHSSEIAAAARQKGLEVMLHLPMQATGNEAAEPNELRPGMTTAAVANSVDRLLAAVPGAVGVNNHQGSEATANPQLMAELMPVLRSHRLFYIDSRTTAATVAYTAAQNAGIRCAFRNVPFLDDVPEVSAVKKQLALAFRGAKDKGEAIAIGHPHPQTIEALRETLPHAEAEGIRLVFASDLVH